MRFVSQKSIEQQDLQALHRVRSRLIGCRTQVGSQIRGLLAEHGIILPHHLSHLRMHLLALFSEEHPLLSSFARELFARLYNELLAKTNAQTVFERRQATHAWITKRGDPYLRML
jgi:transposase